MKTIGISACILIAVTTFSNAQTSPSAISGVSVIEASKLSALGDTLTFAPYAQGTIMNTQYLNKGVVFSGFNGSTDPTIWDYGTGSYGRVLISDNWFNPLRINFVDSSNSSQYRLAQRIEFDNPIAVTEVDFISVDVYDSMNTVIYHYLSASPEHVVINLATPSAAYLTLDDSAGTAYVVDNIQVDFGNTTSINEMAANNFSVYPNPFSDQLTFAETGNSESEIILYDILSKEILKQFFTNKFTVQTNQLGKGIYFYEIRSRNGEVKRGKVMRR